MAITINDMADLVYVTIIDLLPPNIKVSVSSITEDKLEARVNGKIYNFTMTELVEQRYSAKGFINLIKERIK